MRKFLLLLLLLPAYGPVQAQPSTAAPAAVDPVPRRTLTRALVAPGFGQLSNQQPVKAAVVWAGIAAFGTGIALQQRRYLRLRHAAVYTVCLDNDPRTTCADPDFARFAEEAAPYDGYRADALRTLRDGARRDRDLLIAGATVGYLLQALDAYVSAHLRSFDVDERLSVHVVPGPSGASLVMRVSLP